MTSTPVSANAEQFKNSFREEGREILTDLESALLELNENHGDSDLIGRIFRGLHTLKGSGSMFGFERLAAFTHDLETAFDMVRNGRLEVTAELVDQTLSALDQISAMLEEDTGGGTPADEAVCANIISNVRRLAGIQSGKEPAQKKASTPTANPPALASGKSQSWRIYFAPGPDLMRCGANPALILQELRGLGGLSVHAEMKSVPPLAEMDPERCYIAWELVLETAAGLDAIKDAFIFVESNCELAIELASGASADKAALKPTNKVDKTAKVLAEKRAQPGGRRAYDKAENVSSLRVPAERLDQLVNLVGELVTVQARLSELANQRDDTEVTEVAEEVERLTGALRENSMNIRMVPIRGTFEKFRRLVHDLSRDLGKKVELAIEGADTELDKTVIDQLSDPLMHLIRNSMDHGVESPETRAARGKRATAVIHLAARYSGASVLISVSDDGNGIDKEAVRAKAIERGLATADAKLSDSEIFAFIFNAGFSTAKQVTDVSGRGVGMDVVRQSIEGLRGTIEVKSETGAGTCVTLKLPLTLAIIDGLLVIVGETNYVLPLSATLECIELTRADVVANNGKHIVNVRGELVPYVRLREHFHVRGEAPAIEQIMLVETDTGRFGLVVDQVLGNCQTVIKNLGRFYRHVQFVSGATILGNGTVALILDPGRLMQDVMRYARCSRKIRVAASGGGSQNNSVVSSVPGGTNNAGPDAGGNELKQ